MEIGLLRAEIGAYDARIDVAGERFYLELAVTPEYSTKIIEYLDYLATE